MNKLFDFVIIGGGPAGSLSALKLAKSGNKVMLFEASKHFKRKVCGEYLCPQGVSILEEEGLGSLVNNHLLIKGMKIFSPKNVQLNTDFPKITNKNYFGAALNRQVFDQLLLERAMKEGVVIVRGERIQEITPSSYGWEIVSNLQEKIQARYLIGADGRRSTVSKLLNLKSSTGNEHKVALHCHIQTKTETSRYGEMHLFGDGSYIGVNPTGNNEVNISLVTLAAQIKPHGGTHKLFNHYINQSKYLLKKYGLILEKQKINSVSPISNSVPQVVGRNFALIGDAAGFLDPLTGEGIYNALWMAQSLSNLIISESKQALFDYNPALLKYAKNKEAHFRQKNLLNHFFQWLIKQPFLCELVANFLKKSKKRQDTFVGIIGNLYNPLQGLFKLIIS